MIHTRDNILALLHQCKSYASGEEISQQLKITRQALWKHIQELRDLGYDISAVPHLGYKIDAIPDRMFAFEITRLLTTRYMGQEIQYFDALPSTMDVAAQQALQGVKEGTVIITESQTKGRGRLGRHWASPKYKGLYASIILRPAIPPHKTPLLTLLAAVSICEAIKDVTGLEPRIKWPNDIILGDKKAGGILTEMQAEQDAVRYVILGMGINVNTDVKALLPTATSLSEHCSEHVDRLALACAIFRRLEERYEQFKQDGGVSTIQSWRALNQTIGKRVSVAHQTRICEGMAMDIDSDGGLLIRNDTGVIEKVIAGDVTLSR